MGCASSRITERCRTHRNSVGRANARHGFYLILRPEDRAAGSPDPARWIDPLMKYQGIDYRISLLQAAAFHGSSHQAAMVFQVIVPKQLRTFDIGRHRLQFIYQGPGALKQVRGHQRCRADRQGSGGECRSSSAQRASLESIETIDFMTAHWARLPYDFLDHISRRIVNEVSGISQVVYDIL